MKLQWVLTDETGEVVDGPIEMTLDEGTAKNYSRHREGQRFRWVVYKDDLHVVPDFVSED